MHHLYDIDLDFFFSGEAPLTEDNDKKLWLEPEELFFRLQNIQSYLHIEHHETIESWNKENIKGWECWHFDAHSDVGEDGRLSPENLPLGRRADHVTQGNFLLIALREGIFSKIHWVIPPWLPISSAINRLAHLSKSFKEKIICHVWNEASAMLPKPYRADISFSPHFTPLPAVKYILQFLPKDPCSFNDFVDKIVESQKQIRNLVKTPSSFFPDISLKPNGLLLYHGSSDPGLALLKKKPLYLSSSPAVAVSFALPIDQNRGYVHGVDYLTEEMPLPYLALPECETHCLDEPMTLYETTADFEYQTCDEMMGCEYISYDMHHVLYHTNYSNTKNALLEYGVQIGVRGEELIAPCLRKAAKSIPEAVEAYMKMPLDAVLALPALEASLLFFFVCQAKMPLRKFDSLPPRWWIYMLDRVLLPSCSHLILEHKSFEELKYLRDTAIAKGIISWLEGHPPIIPMLAACLQGPLGIKNSDNECDKYNSTFLSEFFFKSHSTKIIPVSKIDNQDIINVIASLNSNRKSKKPATISDQYIDQTLFSWTDVKENEYLHPSAGKLLTHHNPQYISNLVNFTESLGYDLKKFFEIKFELTDACNLQCSFCHNGYGQNNKYRFLSYNDYKRWIERITDEGIRQIRLTGGEPLLLPDLQKYLQLAKDNDLLVTLNSNAVLLNEPKRKEIIPFIDCLKVSFPASDETKMLKTTKVAGMFEQKLEAASWAATVGVKVEFLTPMFPDAIDAVYEFADLLKQAPFIRWVPLRAEPTPFNSRPVNRNDILSLTTMLSCLKSDEHFEDLLLYLA
ncbi:MAG: radical SAM protein, partial [Clostridiales Family XIII bacterium]|nr:radical SAM protein [Clostridiales Family XIII bacterium]